MIFKSKLIKGLLIIAILVTAVKQILLTQVIYALSTSSITLSSSTGGNTSTSILPTDKDEVRQYKWKNQEVTLKKYVETNGQQMIEMEKEIADSSLTPDQKKRLEVFGLLPHPCCNAPINPKMEKKTTKYNRIFPSKEKIVAKFGQEVADLVVYLASDESSFITGASVEINGGTYFI